MSQVQGQDQGPRQNPMFELMLFIAPYFLFALAAVVITAVTMDIIQDRTHPELKHKRFEVAKNLNKLNSAGMAELVVKGSRDRRREP